MRKQVLFIHSGGAQGWKQGSSYLLTYLKTMLGNDYQVLSPEMPEPEHPEYDHWKDELERDFALLREDSILVGHSLGGSVLLKYLSEQRFEIPIAGLFIVAAPYWGLDRWEVEEYRLTDNFQQHLPPINKLVLYHSSNDEVVPFSHLNMYAAKLPWATIRETHGHHLFHQGLPELIADIKALSGATDNKPFKPVASVQLSPAMTTLSPYLHFSGQCREAMAFYKDCLGGELVFQPVKGSTVELQCPAAMHQHILHASLVKDSLVLLATDMSGPDGVHPGNSISLSLNCGSEEEIHHYFARLSAGARITEGLKQQNWGAKFGALIDKYGVGWMLHYMPADK
jgi:uncharacterized protein